jgi:hypothetical protein
MYIKFKNLTGAEVCFIARKIKQEQGHIKFNCSDTGSKVMVPFEDLISISEIPDLPKVAFITDVAMQLEKAKFENINYYWCKDYLYCFPQDCRKLQKILKDSVDMYDGEIILNELPIEDYEYSR